MADSNEYWKGKHYSFFQNSLCEYFPCHKGIPTQDFNCLFCYCPLYALGPKCGGNFVYLDNGIKDCSNCCIPHERDKYGEIISRYKEIAEIAKIKKNTD